MLEEIEAESQKYQRRDEAPSVRCAEDCEGGECWGNTVMWKKQLLINGAILNLFSRFLEEWGDMSWPFYL